MRKHASKENNRNTPQSKWKKKKIDGVETRLGERDVNARGVSGDELINYRGQA